MNLFCTFLGGPRSASAVASQFFYLVATALHSTATALHATDSRAISNNSSDVYSTWCSTAEILHSVDDWDWVVTFRWQTRVDASLSTVNMGGPNSLEAIWRHPQTPWHRNRTPNSIWSKKVTKTGTVYVTTQHVVGRNLWSNHWRLPIRISVTIEYKLRFVPRDVLLTRASLIAGPYPESHRSRRG